VVQTGRSGPWQREARQKDFFSEEKKQKTFAGLSRGSPAADAKGQKFFGSFFQKRTAFFLAALTLRAGASRIWRMA
jgi:hypothetical protein